MASEELRTVFDIGFALQTGRRRLRLTQEQLAERLGVTQTWLSEVEGGKLNARIGKVLEALSAVGVVLGNVSTSKPGMSLARKPAKPAVSSFDDDLPDILTVTPQAYAQRRAQAPSIDDKPAVTSGTSKATTKKTKGPAP